MLLKRLLKGFWVGVLSTWGLVTLWSLSTAFKFAIYPDEPAFLRVNAQIFRDDFQLDSLWPMCRDTMHVPLPWLLYPGALLYNLIYSHVESVFLLRCVGVALASLFAFGLVCFWKKAHRTQGRICNATYLAAFSGLFFLGVSPFLIFFARPEMLIITILCLLSLFAISFPLRADTRFSRALLWTAFSLVLCSLLMFIHEKAVLFLPLVLVLLWFSIGKKKILYFFAVAFVLGAAVSTLGVYMRRASCGEVPQMSKFTADYIAPSALLAHPLEQVPQALGNMFHFGKYSGTTSFRFKNRIGWIPRIDTSQSILADVIDNGDCIVFVLFGLIAVLFSARSLALDFRRIHKLSSATAISGMVLLSTLGMAAVQNSKNFYEYPLVVGLIVLALSIQLTTSRLSPAVRTTLSTLFGLVVVASLGSQIFLHLQFPDKILDARRTAIASIPYLTQLRTTGAIGDLAGRCGLKNSSETENLLVDDITYFYFRETKHLNFMTYIATFEIAVGDADRAGFLVDARKLNTGGAIALCERFPASVVDRTVKSGPFCCLSRQGLDEAH